MPLADLERTLADFPWCYLVTVDESRPHARAVPTEIVPGGPGDPGCRLRALVGRTTLANLAIHPSVTLLFPHPDPAARSLIVDGVGESAGTPQPGGSPAGMSDWLLITPTAAVLHRGALQPSAECSPTTAADQDGTARR